MIPKLHSDHLRVVYHPLYASPPTPESRSKKGANPPIQSNTNEFPKSNCFGMSPNKLDLTPGTLPPYLRPANLGIW